MRASWNALAFTSLLSLACFAVGSPASAQEWFTPEACLIKEARIDPDAYPPALEQQFRTQLADIPNPNGRLWRVVAADGATSHLWGSYHTPHPLLLDLPDTFRSILDEARVVALEFDYLPDSRADLQNSFQIDSMWLPWEAGREYRADITPEVLGWITQRMTDLDWDPTYLPDMTDAGLFQLLIGDPCGDYLVSVLLGQDFYIAQEALLAGAEVTGLQRPEDLANQLNHPSRAANARALIKLYAAGLGPEGADPTLRSTAYALYLQGRLGELDLWSSDWLKGFYGPEEAARIEGLAEDYILTERNGFFAAAARPLLDQGGAVLVVGASHLPGELGMVELLRDAGYQVERVPLPGEPP